MFKGWMATRDEENFLKNNEIQTDYKWHINGKLVEGKRALALGRSCYYLSFIKTISDHFKEDIYQSDFMTWNPNKTAKPNLQYYIGTADEIHFSLRGIEAEQIKQAVIDGKEFPYMTMWEIQYIILSGWEDKVWWYTDKDDVAEVLYKLGIHKIRRLRFKSKKLSDRSIAENGYKYYKIS